MESTSNPTQEKPKRCLCKYVLITALVFSFAINLVLAYLIVIMNEEIDMLENNGSSRSETTSTPRQ